MAINEYDIAKLYQEMELDLIASLKRNLYRHLKTEREEEIKYPQWQALKLKEIEKVKKENLEIVNKYTSGIPKDVRRIIKREYKQGKTSELKLYNKTHEGNGYKLNENFFTVDNKKINALIDEINGTLKDSKHAILRMTNDQYRSTIFKSQFYLEHGAVSLEQAINMSVKEFINNGIKCIEYSNGRRVNIADYSRMAIRTASQRAMLEGEGQFRKKLNRPLVIVTKHNTACKLCSPWQGEILIDDVYSGGVNDGKHKTVSEAMAKGLFHPNCRHGLPTYYPELDEVYEEIGKQKTDKEKEEKLRDEISQYKQKERRKEVWNNDDKYNVSKEDFVKFRDEGFNQDLPEIIEKINKADPNIRKIYKKRINELNNVYKTKNVGVYSVDANFIKYSDESEKVIKEGVNRLSVYFHEQGHFFDKFDYFEGLTYNESSILEKYMRKEGRGYIPRIAREYFPSSSDQFLNALDKDKEIFEDLRKKGIRIQLFRELAENHATSSLQDILNGMYSDQKRQIMPWGHTESYYNEKSVRAQKHIKLEEIKKAYNEAGYAIKNKTEMRMKMRRYQVSCEAWAHMFSAYTTRTEEMNILEKYLPNTTSVFKEIIKGVK